MGYYAEGDGIIYFGKKLSHEERDALVNEFDKAAESCFTTFDFENTVFGISLAGKYREEYVVSLLSRLAKILPIKSGEIKYFGEHNAIWRFIFDKNQNKWLEQDADITFPEPTTNKIYTHDEASRLLELFENVLMQHNICVPSPEDDERDPDDMVGLYGSTYSDLLDAVEFNICEIINRCKQGADVVEYEYSGNY